MQRDQRPETNLTYYISNTYNANLNICVPLFCHVVFYSYLCIKLVARSISKKTKVSPNKQKNNQKSNTILFKIQHKTSNMYQNPTFSHSKTQKMSPSFFELIESGRKTYLPVYQKHTLTSIKTVQKCFKIHFFESKKHHFFAPSGLTFM